MTLNDAMKIANNLVAFKMAMENKTGKVMPMNPSWWQTIKTLFTTIFTTNTWMSNTQFLAFMAHGGVFGFIMMTVGMFSGFSYAWLAVVSCMLLITAAIKEFWYDRSYEQPPQSALDNIEDFVGYFSGVALAWIMVLIHTA
jgi:hypothetical protein